jgi:probable HAF family extracellular repeat protein
MLTLRGCPIGVNPSGHNENQGGNGHMRVTRALAATVSLGVLVAAASPANAATVYTFTQFDEPGATRQPGTAASGINDAGQIVGFFNDSTGTHGFLRLPGERRKESLDPKDPDTSGSFTTVDVPGAFITWARGINNAGRIVGLFIERSALGPEHGFLFTGGLRRDDDGNGDGFQDGGKKQTGPQHCPKFGRCGSFTQIDVPGVPGNTAATDINNVGQIVGAFGDSTGGHGFLDIRGSFTTFDVPGATSTDGSGVNDAGQIVGTFLTPDIPVQRRHGYLRDTSGSLTTIDMPGATDTTAVGINNVGQIVGYFSVSLPEEHGFLRYTSGSFTTLDVPGATRTAAHAINNQGQIVGFFTDIRGEHGFLATPVFAGTPGKSNCHGKSVSALARQYGGLNAAAAALDYPSVSALQDTILAFCGG